MTLFKKKEPLPSIPLYCRDCGMNLPDMPGDTIVWLPRQAYCKNARCSLYHLWQLGEMEPPIQVRKNAA